MSDGEIFDPEIHATDKDGNPSVNKDGSFRKKRRDASRVAAAPASSEGKRAADQKAAYRRSVQGILQVPATILSLVDPVDGYCAAQLVDPWAEVLADLAGEYPQLAAAIERASVAGPLAGLIGVGLMTAVQFAHNHGKVPAHIAAMVGARPRADIEKILAQRGAQLAAEAEERKHAEGMAQVVQERVEAEQEGAVEHEYAGAV